MSWETGGEGDWFQADSDLYWGYAACGAGTRKRRGVRACGCRLD